MLLYQRNNGKLFRFSKEGGDRHAIYYESTQFNKRKQKQKAQPSFRGADCQVNGGQHSAKLYDRKD